jgi:signal-transduction protein with cAMP-binding, CBS, and nucleotidyltransferase domain
MLCGMQEIARFLATHPPFDGLPPEALEQTAATVEIAYFPRGSSILRQSGEPSRYLHVIVKGVVELRQADDRGASELVETLAEGETFGHRDADWKRCATACAVVGASAREVLVVLIARSASPVDFGHRCLHLTSHLVQTVDNAAVSVNHTKRARGQGAGGQARWICM